MNFNDTYSRDSFRSLVKGLLPDYSDDARKVSIDSPSSHIKEAYLLGESGDLELSVFEIQHSGSADKRVSLAHAGFRLMKGVGCYRALIAYHSQDTESWRLSLMTLYPAVSVKGKVTLEASNPRRYSYFLGPDAKVHTPYDRLIKSGAVKDFDDLLARFSVEVVTNEFFKQYRTLFETLVKHLEKDHAFTGFAARSGIAIEDFAKKLLGQIVFIYFLQRKRWVGAKKGKSIHEGDKDFIRTLFQKAIAEQKNFFNEYLEPLFYDGLNSPPKRAGSFYRDYFDCQIPFLNGGLFEPLKNYDWRNAFLFIPDELFSNKEETGILDIFDLYNFTVAEDDPIDVEVSVDPEMLGKVFENLLAENLRKGKGTYYTPREIVHYMCRESLIQHLSSEAKMDAREIRYLCEWDGLPETKLISRWDDLENKQAPALIEALSTIKVVDPACGSGAFLVGMLQEIFHLWRKLALGVTGDSFPEYETKKRVIQNSIYGVDIDPGAVEIAKLRLWLSMVVDYDLDDIEPLPNLDYKIMQGNSLLEELIIGDTSLKLYDPKLNNGSNKRKRKNLFEDDEQQDLFGQTSGQHRLIDELNRLHKKYFSLSDLKAKRAQRDKIQVIEHELVERTVKQELKKIEGQSKNIGKYLSPTTGMSEQDAKRYAKNLSKQVQLSAILKEFDASTNRPYFLWHLNFADVFEKKGGFDVVVANPPYVRADSGPEYLAFRKKLEGSNTYKTLYEKWDLMVPFIEKGLNIANPKGDLTYIVSNAICTSKYAFKLLDWIQKKFFTYCIDYFEDMAVFEAGVVPVVLHIGKVKDDKITRKIVHRGSFENIVRKVEIPVDEFRALGRDAFRKELNPTVLKIKTINLGDIYYLSYGLRPNSDERFWKGEFTAKDVISTRKDKTHSRSYVEGKDLVNYFISRVRYLEWGTDRVPRKLVRPTFPELYERPKIMRGILTGGVFDESGIVCNHSIVVFVRFVDLRGVNNKSIHSSIKKFNRQSRAELEKISQKFDLKYILAILNSSFALSYLNNIRRHRLENYFYPDDFRKLPIADISPKEQKPFIDIVDSILAITKDDDYLENPSKQAKVREYEKQIDQLVYNLYGLTAEEIKIIEQYQAYG